MGYVYALIAAVLFGANGSVTKLTMEAGLSPAQVTQFRLIGTALIAGALITLTEGLPAWAVLTVLMVVTMTLSDVLNNTATTIVAAPVGIEMARVLGVSPDPFLMAVAVAASCAFLTPIGHKNNTLILGPGGYRFGDYWRMGLPLEVLVIAVSIPAILVFWPM